MTERTVADSGRFRRTGLLERIGSVLAGIPDGPPRRLLRALFRRLIGRRPLECTPGGERLRILPEYRFVTWNEAEVAAFRGAVAAGDVVLDVGANVGAYALLFGRWTGPEGRVFAFEPSPEARAGLLAHVTLNGLDGVVEARPQAAADRAGSEALRDEGLHGSSRLGAGDTAVETVTLDGFCEAQGVLPALVKVDVEGAELRVLRGARRLMAGPRPPALFVELHPSVWPELGVTREAVEAELAAQGLRVEPLRAGVDPWTLEGECVRLVRG